jgi:hypothetical protein
MVGRAWPHAAGSVASWLVTQWTVLVVPSLRGVANGNALADPHGRKDLQLAYTVAYQHRADDHEDHSEDGVVSFD